MFYKLIKQSIVKFFIALFLVTLCSSITVLAQSFVGQVDLPSNSVFPFYRHWEEGYGGNNPQIVVNSNTNRVYTHLRDEYGSSLIEIDGANNTFRRISIGITNAAGIGIDSVRNRIYMTGEMHNYGSVLVVYDVNNGSLNVISLPGIGDYIAVNPTTNRIYLTTMDQYIYEVNGDDFNITTITFPAPVIMQSWWNMYDIAVNKTTNQIYINVDIGLLVMDGNSKNITEIAWSETDQFGSRGGLAVNEITNRIYIAGLDSGKVGILNGTNNSFEGVEVPNECSSYNYGGVITINQNTNRVYIPCSYHYPDIGRVGSGLITLDGATNNVTVKQLSNDSDYIEMFGLAINPVTNRIYIPTGYGTPNPSVKVIDPGSSGTISAEQPVVQADGATLDFTDANLTGEGTVTVTPISDPAIAGDIPGGFAISDQLAFEIHPDENLVFNGPVTSCFKIPTVNDEAEFNSLAVLHREETSPGVFGLVDRTSSHDFATRTICATTTSFSPFYIARKANKIQSLFERAKAYKKGSTVPVKLQLLDANNQNISSSNTPFSVRGLRKIGTNTTTVVTDAGNSNPDYNFRFVGDQYHYNLKTTGLTAGRYVLSFYAGADRSFFYTVEFEIK